MRVEYIGMSVAKLGVSIPDEPPVQCGFSYGQRFRKPGASRVFEENVFGIDPAREDGADVLVLEPGEFDDTDAVVVAVVNERCLQNPRLLEWLRRTLTLTPHGPSYARVFVPESKAGGKGAARELQKRFQRKGVTADAISYYPALVK